MLTKNEEINLYRGGSSVLRVDMTEFELSGGHVDFIIEDKDGRRLFCRSMDEKKVYELLIPYTLTESMEVSRREYSYGLTHCVDGQRFPLCLSSPVIVGRVASGCGEE